MWIKEYVQVAVATGDHLVHMQQSLFCLENQMCEILYAQCLLIATILPHLQVAGTQCLLQGSNSLMIEPHQNSVLDC